MTDTSRARLLIARGPGAAEDLLLEEVLAAGARFQSSLDFSRPLLVVLPSRSLREHLMRKLVTVRGSSILGVQFVTHHGLALRILDSLGMLAPHGIDLFPILARRFAREEPALCDALDHLYEGYNGILGAVRDLLDAGFQIPHLEGVEEALEADGSQVASRGELDRATALARVTARVLAAFDELGVGRTSTLLRSATDAVREAPNDALSTSAVFLHGFADATGVTSDFLTSLLQAYGGLAMIDRPPDPGETASEDVSSTFTDRLLGHFTACGELEEAESEAPTIDLRFFRALGREAELREVAQRCRALLEAGTCPEAIGIVMRDPGPYRSLLRGTLDRFAIPFSGHGITGPVTPVGRRLAALIEIVAAGSRCHIERWLDAAPERIAGTPTFDIRIALAALGVGRLDELRTLDYSELIVNGTYPLPVRQGFFEAAEESDGSKVVRTRRRRVPEKALAEAQASASAVATLLDEWLGARLSLPEHAVLLRELIPALGWDESTREAAAVERLLEAVLAAPPLSVDQEEFVLTLRRLAIDSGRDEFAGNGGGIQIMGVIEARARTFEHLFVLGMNRGVFPRTVREDPVLSDPLRKLLSANGHGVLPDLPIKARGYMEERYLFSQLLAASPKTTLSWLETDDAERPLAPSPLVERLRWCHPARDDSWRDPPLVGRHPIIDGGADGVPTPERLERLSPPDQAVLAALHGRISRLPSVLPTVLAAEAVDQRFEVPIDPRQVAAARISVIDELDPLSAKVGASCLSPYLGFVGPAQNDDDPRSNQKLWVTALERMAACPWQSFIERILRVESVPDPLEALPRIDPLTIGIVVHRVLERIVRDAIPVNTAEISELDPTAAIPVNWPDTETLDRIIGQEADDTVRDVGIALGGFARALAAVVRPYLEVARRVDWSAGQLPALAVETNGELPISAPGLAPRAAAFRADRVDGIAQLLLLTDYKTGTPEFTQTQKRFRDRAYLKSVRAGQRLQPLVYALATGGQGRFLFLRPDTEISDERRSFVVPAGDGELDSALFSTLSTVLTAWERGFFFPRMELPGIKRAPGNSCKWCRVAEACMKQDSGVRRRLRVGMTALVDDPPDDLDEESRRALLDHWWLPESDHRPPPLSDDQGGSDS